MKKQIQNTLFIYIILALALIFNACGYKTPPTYKKAKQVKVIKTVKTPNSITPTKNKKK